MKRHPNIVARAFFPVAIVVAIAAAIGCSDSPSESTREAASAASEATECINFEDSCSATENTISCSGLWGSFSMTCGNPDTLEDCTYSEHFVDVPDVCAGTPRYWEDESYYYSETCSEVAECSSDGSLATSSSGLKIAATDGGGKGGPLTKINACYEACRKGIAVCLLCWSGLTAAAGPPAPGKPAPPKPPNITQVEKIKREIKKKLQFGKQQKAVPGAEAGPTMPKR